MDAERERLYSVGRPSASERLARDPGDGVPPVDQDELEEPA